MNLSAKEVESLVDLLRKQMLFQTPTIVQEGISAPRAHVAFMLPAYESIMLLIARAGGWQMPAEHRAKLEAMF
jgi:hypothetical protein